MVPMPENAAPFSLRLPADLLQAIDAYAENRGVTRSHIIRMACRAYMDGDGNAEPVEDRLAALEARVKALEEGK